MLGHFFLSMLRFVMTCLRFVVLLSKYSFIVLLGQTHFVFDEGLKSSSVSFKNIFNDRGM
jgi:hypothetical protein